MDNALPLAYLVCSVCGRSMPVIGNSRAAQGWRIMEIAGWTVLRLGVYACRHCSKSTQETF